MLFFGFSYPTDTDKLMLAKQTGLSRNQVRFFLLFSHLCMKVLKLIKCEVTWETLHFYFPSLFHASILKIDFFP